MNAKAATPSLLRRRPVATVVITAIGVVLAVALAAVAVGESMGWPVLAGPLQRLLADKLDRRVSFSPSASGTGPAMTQTKTQTQQQAQEAFSVSFLGGLRLRAAQLEIGAPGWSTSPHLVLARDVALDLRYTDLWRAYRGQLLRIDRLRASTLDANLERLADGRASWQFSRPDSVTPFALPRFGRLDVADGILRYRDKPFDLDFDAKLSLVDSSSAAVLAGAAASSAAGAASAANGLQVNATGRYQKLPLKITLTSSGVLPWVADEAATVPVPVTVNATVGRASLVFNGSATDALTLGGLSGRFSVKGPSLAAVGDPVGVTLPTTGAFRTEGMVVKQNDTWRVTVDTAIVGSSRLNGAFTFDAGRRVPLLSGRLGGSRLLLADLGPVVGTTPAVASTAAAADAGADVDRPPKALANTAKLKGKVLPDRPFDLAALRAMDANVLIDISDVDLSTRLLEPLRPLHAHLQLAGGVLTLSDLDARTANGRLMGALSLDGRGSTALWNGDVRWDGVRLERWVRQTRKEGAPPYVSGRLDGRATLRGQGRSTAEILASLKGNVRTQLRGGTVSHLVIEAAGIDLAQSLVVLLKGDDALKVECAVADLVAEGGVLRPRVIVIDTEDSTVVVDGSVSLATEGLDLRAVVSPKDFSPLALRTPLRVRGSFANPEVSLDKGPLGAKLAAAALLALVNPIAALIPLLDPGDSEAAQRDGVGCAGLRQRTAQRAPNRGSAR